MPFSAVVLAVPSPATADEISWSTQVMETGRSASLTMATGSSVVHGAISEVLLAAPTPGIPMIAPDMLPPLVATTPSTENWMSFHGSYGFLLDTLPGREDMGCCWVSKRRIDCIMGSYEGVGWLVEGIG